MVELLYLHAEGYKSRFTVFECYHDLVLGCFQSVFFLQNILDEHLGWLPIYLFVWPDNSEIFLEDLQNSLRQKYLFEYLISEICESSNEISSMDLFHNSQLVVYND